MARQYTNKLIDMMDQGLISAQAVAEMALAYMSEADVEDMMLCNDILEEDEYEDDGQPTELEEWMDFDPDC